MTDTEFPRRICLDKLTPAETAIVAAQHAVEAAGGGPHLTAATQLLAEARARVADHVDGVPVPEVIDNASSEVVCELLDERLRQIEAEGWTPEHDDDHDDGSLAMAAAAYSVAPFGLARLCWPSTWSSDWYKPAKQPRRNLVKAGALIIAEIERLDRAEVQP